MHIHVFADHCASSFWNAEDGIMLYEHDLGLPETLLLAVKYWTDMWDFAIGDQCIMSNSYIDQWHVDGQRLVELMNDQCTCNFTFEYKEFR